MDYMIEYIVVGVVILCVIAFFVVKKKKDKPKTIEDALEPGKDEHDKAIDKIADECAKEPDQDKRAEKIRKLAKAAREFPRGKRGDK